MNKCLRNNIHGNKGGECVSDGATMRMDETPRPNTGNLMWWLGDRHEIRHVISLEV
jgi:hypothetical protein